MAFHITEGSRGRASILQVPSRPDAPSGAQKFSGMTGLSPMTPRTPGADSWRLGTAAADHHDDVGRASTPMRTRKATTGPPGWMVSAAETNTFDASGTHMRAHIQSLANLDKEVLAEKLFHTKIKVSELMTENKRAHVYSRRLEGTLARQEMQSSSGIRSLSPAAAGERRTQSDIVRNLKSKNRTLRQERNKALAMVNKLQKTVRIAYVHELEAEVRVLQEEVANQQALATAAREKLRMSLAHGSPPLPTRFGTRPHTSHTTDGRRRLAEVLQELQVARRTLEREGKKLRDACGHLSTADVAGKPQMQTALKVIAFLQEHTVKMVEHLTSVPQSEDLIESLANLGVVAPAPPSDSPSPIQLDSLKLPSSLTALAAPVATAVARVEALTAAEVEQDPWLHDTLVNFAVIAQKFIDASGALRAPPGSTADSVTGGASADTAASDGAPGGAPSAQEPAEAETAAEDAAATEDDGLTKGLGSVSLCQSQLGRTESSASAYESSAAGSSDGSAAAGSVSVNHTGISGRDGGDSTAGDRCTSERQDPLDTEMVGHHGMEESSAAPAAQDTSGSIDNAPASVASASSGNAEPAEGTVAEVDGACRADSGDIGPAGSELDTGVVATAASLVASDHVADSSEPNPAGSTEIARVVSTDAPSFEMKEAGAHVGDLKGNTASMEEQCTQNEETVDSTCLALSAVAHGGGAGADTADVQDEVSASCERKDDCTPDTAEPSHEGDCEPEHVVDDGDVDEALAQSDLEDADPAEVTEGAEEVGDEAEERDLALEQADVNFDGPEVDTAQNADLMDEEGPPPLELPEVLEEPVQEAAHAEEREDNSGELCSEVLPVDEDEGGDGDHNLSALEQKGETPDAAGAAPGASQPSLELGTAAGSVVKDLGTGRETRDSEVAEGMVDEVLEETLASMLSADARQFAQ